MTLFSPWNLLWLAPTLGGILALWMLRRRRQDVVVPSLLLWQTLLQDAQTNTLARRLQRHLLLFLQLLAAFLLIFALARPFVYGRGLTGRVLIVVIDNSASMAATDVRPTRLDAARDAARDFLRHEMNGSDVATVITTSARPETTVGLTGDRARLEDALDQITRTDAPGDLPAALTLAQSLTRGRASSQIRVFTDGVIGPDDTAKITALPFGGTQVGQEVVGSPAAQNVAITALDARRDPQSERTDVFVAVRRFGPGGHAGGTLSLLRNGRLVDARALPATGDDDETFDSPLLQRGGVLTARLDDVRDDLATDNAASIVLPPPVKRRVLLVSDGNLFLEKALNLDPATTLEECPPAEFATAGKRGAGYDLVVFDGALPSGTLPPVNALIFAAGNRQTPLVPSGGSVGPPKFLDENHTHPVMQFVDLSGVHVRALRRTTAQPGATVLAEGQNGPWIAAQETNGRRLVSVAFDLADSDWPLRVSFPIFIANAVDWLAQGGKLGVTESQSAAGRPFSVVVPPGSNSLAVMSPDGRAHAVAAPPAGGVVTFADTATAGVYHVRRGNGMDYPAAVDLLDAAVSDLTPRQIAGLDHPGTYPRLADVPLASRVRRDLWPTLAAAALVLLLLEWVVYHRR